MAILDGNKACISAVLKPEFPGGPQMVFSYRAEFHKPRKIVSSQYILYTREWEMTSLSVLGGGFKSGQQPVTALAWAKVPHRRSPALPYRRQLHPDSGKLVPVVVGRPDHATPPQQT